MYIVDAGMVFEEINLHIIDVAVLMVQFLSSLVVLVYFLLSL
jgi:hypothetical protein